MISRRDNRDRKHAKARFEKYLLVSAFNANAGFETRDEAASEGSLTSDTLVARVPPALRVYQYAV